MEKLPELGTAISQVVLPTIQLYAPLLAKQADAIKSTKRESFAYGQHARQQLDVYTPSNISRSPTRILVFLYGGGLVRGDKINPDAQGLVYANVGHFFAERLGCQVVIPDYRLINHGAKFPSGGEDLALVIDWVKENIARNTSKPLDLYLMGNSAGGIHLSTYVFSQHFSKSRHTILRKDAAALRLRGIILLAVPFHFDQATPDRAETLHAYWGSEVRQNCPLGLLEASKKDGTIEQLEEVSVLILTGDLDPEDEILVPNEDFVKELQGTASIGSRVTKIVIKGHNHISPVLSLGTGIDTEEEWGRQVVEFIDGCA